MAINLLLTEKMVQPVINEWLLLLAEFKLKITIKREVVFGYIVDIYSRKKI